MVQTGYDFDRSDAAIRVLQHGRHRAARRRAAWAELETRTFMIDGAPEPFTSSGLDDVWVAHREHFGVTVKLAARGFYPHEVELAPVDGPAIVRGAGSACAGRPVAHSRGSRRADR